MAAEIDGGNEAGAIAAFAAVTLEEEGAADERGCFGFSSSVAPGSGEVGCGGGGTGAGGGEKGLG